MMKKACYIVQNSADGIILRHEPADNTLQFWEPVPDSIRWIWMYEIDLDEVEKPEDVLSWLVQLQSKLWATPQLLNNVLLFFRRFHGTKKIFNTYLTATK